MKLKNNGPRSANTAALVAVIFFTAYRALSSLVGGELWQAVMTVMAGLVALGAVLALSRAGRPYTTALFVPMFLLAVYGLTGFTLHGFSDFVVVYLGLCCISLFYGDTKALLSLLLAGDLFAAFLALAAPLLHLSAADGALDAATFVMLIPISVLLCLICAGDEQNREQSRTAQDALRRLLTSTPNIAAILDEVGRIRHISEPLAELAGLKSAEAALGWPLIDLLPNPEMKNIVSGILARPDSQRETADISLGGERRLFQVTTDKSSAEDIFIEIADITPAGKTGAETEAPPQSPSYFLASVSHELRAPMNVILSMSGLAQSEGDSRRKNECLRGIDDAAAQMLSLVNDILDMAKIETNELELTDGEFVLADMLRQTAEEIRPRARAKKQDFTCSFDGGPPELLSGDELRLSQVVSALLAHAVKFTPEGGAFRLAAESLQEEGQVSAIKIEVGGQEMDPDPEDRRRLLGRFPQEESEARSGYDGAELPLAVASRIASLMGGRIWAAAQPSGGLTLVFTARLGRGADASVGDRPAGESFRGQHILLAEDVAVNREIVLALLEPAEISVSCAENGAQAVRMFAAEPERYDMIFMDTLMPEMNGYEAARRIRALDLPRAGLVPIVAMTDFRGDKDQCLTAGMSDCLEKPLDLERTLGKLHKYLRPGSEKSDGADEKSGDFDWSHGIAWSPELETGHAEIDAQHRQLFRLTSALVDACAKGRSTAVLGEALDFLAAYTVRHFADEEALQIQYAFPEYARHKKMHDDFKETALALIAEYKAGESAEELSGKVFSVIVRWLLRHIKGEDAKIAEHIRSVCADAQPSSHTA
ncbi:MAG: bacteriohemerythrin [Gracilibacteraceae bacterium]|jgi:hemerythrin-like metal-binding protein|nr:bacteriohemerythrin [Gracilibacteraceae bacterium]